MTFAQHDIRYLISDINKKLLTSQCYNHSIFSGTLGLIYYYFNASILLKDNSLSQKGGELLVGVFDDLNNGTQKLMGSELSRGASGFAFVVNYLQLNNMISLDIEEELSEMDQFIFEGALARLEENKIDYLHGALGAFNYFSERQGSERCSYYLNEIASKVFDKAIEETYGLRFINLGLERFTEKDIDLSLAHGLSGILLLLLKAFPQLTDQKRAETIIRKGIMTILNHEQMISDINSQFSLFPCAIKSDTNEIKLFDRLAWCYGDLNQLLLLFRAGTVLNDKKYTDIAKRMMPSIVRRISKEQTLVTDTHFCHGTAGLVKIYDCLYDETMEEDFKIAKEYWLQQTLILTRKELDNDQYAINPVSLLEGWAGVALVLSDSLGDDKLSWGNLFLL